MTEGQQKILEFGKWCLDVYFEHNCCDIDGGDIDEALERLGLFEKDTFQEPCDPKDCVCRDEYGLDFPTVCTRLTAEVMQARKEN